MTGLSQMYDPPRQIMPFALPRAEPPPVHPGAYVIDLRSALQVLRRRKLTVIAAIGACLLALAAYKALVPAMYAAGTRVLIDPLGLQVVDRDVKPQASVGSETFAFVESQMRVMTSDEVFGDVADRLGLDADSEFGAKPPSLVSRLKAMLLASADAGGDPRLKALRELGDAVAISRTQNSYVVDLSVRTGDPEKSATIANAISESYVAYEFDSRTALAQGVSVTLASRLEELRAEVQAAEERVEEFARANGIVQFASNDGSGQFSRDNIIAGAGGPLLSEQQLATLSGELLRARALTSEAEARYRQIEELQRIGASVDSLTEAVQSETVAQLRAQYAAARQVASSLAETLSERHPRLIEARARVESVAGIIGEEIDRISASARQAYERARRNEAQLAAQLSALESDNADANEMLVQLRELQRAARASRVVYESYLVRYREIEEQKTINTAVARVLSPAVPPNEPSGPSIKVLLALALVFGSAMGGGLAYFRDQFDPKIRSRDQLAATTGLPVLGEIDADVDCGRPDPEAPSLLASEEIPAIVHHRPSSSAAFAFAHVVRQLRDRIGGASRHRLLVTATGEGDGKSTVALNLALAAASGGERVLLIDGDLAFQHLSRNSDRSGISGLVDAVAGRSPIAMALSGIPGTSVSLLASFAWDHTEAAQPTPQAIARLLQAADMFRTVIIDGPLLGPDPWLHSFARNMDGLVVVAKSGRTERQRLADGLSFLRDCAVQPSGSVLIS